MSKEAVRGEGEAVFATRLSVCPPDQGIPISEPQQTAGCRVEAAGVSPQGSSE